jgi:hypothetical protein
VAVRHVLAFFAAVLACEFEVLQGPRREHPR